MAQINFPAASESPWYNPDNGVTYEYIGGTWRTVTTASQLDAIYVKKIGDTMTGELILHGNPAQNLGATPKQYVDTEITNAISDSEDSERLTSDGRYLRKDAGAGNQTVASTGTTTFNGLVEGGAGVKVSGGIPIGIVNGLQGNPNGDYLALVSGSTPRLEMGLNENILTVPDTATGIGVDIKSDSTVANANVRGCYAQLASSASKIDSYTGFMADMNPAGSATTTYGYFATTGIGNGGDTSYGFYSALGSGSNKYNFYAAGSAPNYFEGITEHKGGVNVTGGNVVKSGNGFYGFSSDDNNNACQFRYFEDSNTTDLMLARDAETPDTVVSHRFLNDKDPEGKNVIYSENFAQTKFNRGIDVRSLPNNETLLRGIFSAPVIKNTATVATVEAVHATISNGGTGDLGTINRATGLYTLINDDAATNAFSIFSAGDAPSFHTSDVYIGGTAAANTRELWESLLTEEQKEQLAAGTLAIPANVSTPGDGSFVRQWWYDQQSAEDQALIDAGEIEYPERYQAANFVDTFALGDNTRINLLSNGNAEFGGKLEVKGTDESTLRLTNTNGATDNKTILFKCEDNGTKLKVQAINDAGVGSGSTFSFKRTGNLIDNFSANVDGNPWFSIDNTDKTIGNDNWSIANDGTATGITVTRAAVVTDEQAGTVETLLDIITDLRARITELESNTLQPLYSTVADLPSAADHHGKTAHVHSEGALYFAHGGNWVKLQNA